MLDIEKLISQIETFLPSWLSKQRWFSSEDSLDSVKIDTYKVFEREDLEAPLIWCLATVDGSIKYQLLLGLSSTPLSLEVPDADHFVLGELDGLTIFDALADAILPTVFVENISSRKIIASKSKLLAAEQSNTSIVLDGKDFVKIFRRVQKGSNPDLEVTSKLTELHFANTAPVKFAWQLDDMDLVVCQPFLNGGTDGWQFALNSLREHLELAHLAPCPPAFATEMENLGRTTAELHIALSRGFSLEDFQVSKLVDSLESSLDELDVEYRESLTRLTNQLRENINGDFGNAIRVHGDYHLGQTLNVDGNWFIFDFEGEPVRPLEERNLPTSAFKDFTGMLRSIQYAAFAVLFDLNDGDASKYSSEIELWESECRQAFTNGYMSTDGVDLILPQNKVLLNLLSRAFEVEKAIYELRYEKAFRPAWVAIPNSALKRLLSC